MANAKVAEGPAEDVIGSEQVVHEQEVRAIKSSKRKKAEDPSTKTNIAKVDTN